MLQAQVSIKEKVTILPKLGNVKKNGLRRATSSIDISGFVMNQKGYLSVYYQNANRVFTDFPSYVALIVNVRHGDTVVTDYIGPRFRIHSRGNWTYNNSCTGMPENDSTEVYSSPRGPLIGPHVQPGDTVQFFYLTDGTPDTLSIMTADTFSYGWNLNFGRNSDCILLAENLSNVFVGVTDTIVKFILPTTDSTVYPRDSSAQNNTPVTKDTLDMALKVQFGDSLIKNYWVKVDTSMLIDNGGHEHDGLRPKGQFLIPNGNGYTKVNTFSQQTDSTGKIQFKFLASEFGGIEKITARRIADTTSIDTIKITTQVPGLVPMPPDASYSLSGFKTFHPGNHWITPVARDSLKSGARAFLTAPWNNRGEQLVLNDMSLQYGGGFDVDTGWSIDIDSPTYKTRGHGSHRKGTDVDIENLSRLHQLIATLTKHRWHFWDEGQLRLISPSTRYPHFHFQ